MKHRELFFILVALASALAYLLFADARGAIGFPLDDAWIHQVYARNLGARGEFAFFAGQLSAGSTAPLWTILLAVGYVARIEFHAWTFLLGALFLGLSAIVAARLAEHLFPQFPLSAFHLPLSSFLFPLFLLFEWHLSWSAVSGMEIPLFVFLSLILLERFFARERASQTPRTVRGWLLGLLAGFLTLTRPEGVVLAALVAVGIVGQEIEPRRREGRKEKLIKNLRVLCIFAVQFGIGFGIVITPYLLFNLAASGALLPNTFYAKNAEYAVLFERAPFVVRWLQLLAVPWVGAQILLLPGFVFIVAALAMKRQWTALIPFAWLLLLPALYALRLPVAYQHGRYEMPVVPLIVLYGIWGTAALLARIKNRIVRGTWVLSTGAVLIAFWYLGAHAYATDVAIIDCEMVQTARWVAANAPADAVIAAHDIGALGYFYERPFVDLAGLVSPEVIPFIRDEGPLRDYLFSRHATFVIFFPDWYPALASDPRFVPAYRRDCAVTREAGGTNMIVYEIVLTVRR